MSLKDKLEIIIPTYNRKKYLDEQLVNILNSPIKDCNITVLDNNSSDGTSELCEKYSKKYSNIKHIKHRYNLGLAGNLVEGLKLPEKKYFWMIFDDTKIDFTYWKDAEERIMADDDVIVTTNYHTKDPDDKPAILLMLIYMFSGIFKSKLITQNVILYAVTDIYTIHPQLALINNIFNKKNSIITLLKNPIASPRNKNPEKEYSFNRTNKDYHHFRTEPSSFPPGLLNGLKSLKDDNFRKKIIQMLFAEHNKVGPFFSDKVFAKQFIEKNMNAQNFADIFINLDKKHKINLLFYIFFYLFKLDLIKDFLTKIRKFIYKKIKKENERQVIILGFIKFNYKSYNKKKNNKNVDKR